MNVFLGTVIAPLLRILIILSPAIYLFGGGLPIHASVEQLGLYLFPLALAYYAGMAWISHGAILPMIGEAIAAIENRATLRAGLLGLPRPAGHKFRVPAKGIDRRSAVFHWPLIGFFSLPIMLYVIGLFLNAAGAGLVPDDPGGFVVVSLFCYYNSTIL